MFSDENEVLFDQLKSGCPSCCKSDGFYAGPRGGMSQNIFCMNALCRAEYLVTVVATGVGFATASGTADLRRYAFAIDQHEGARWEPIRLERERTMAERQHESKAVIVTDERFYGDLFRHCALVLRGEPMFFNCVFIGCTFDPPVMDDRWQQVLIGCVVEG
jgi:hypothetical protein